MHVRTERTIEGIPPARAASWWTDVRDGGTDHGFVPGATRHVLHADEHGFEVTDHVRWLGIPVFTEHATARVRGNTVHVVGENTYARFEARYRFEHAFEPEGTRLVLEAFVDPRGPLSWVSSLLEPLVERILAWDTDKHAAQLERDVTSPVPPDQEEEPPRPRTR